MICKKIYKHFTINILEGIFYFIQSSDSIGRIPIDTDTTLIQLHCDTCISQI